MTDLARELEELLCDCDRRNGDHGDHWASCAWRVRGPAVLAFIRAKLAEAHADSELLAKVEAYLKESSDLTLFEVQGDFFIDYPPSRIVAPALREALRKLVEEKP